MNVHIFATIAQFFSNSMSFVTTTSPPKKKKIIISSCFKKKKTRQSNMIIVFLFILKGAFVKQDAVTSLHLRLHYTYFSKEKKNKWANKKKEHPFLFV